MINLLPPELKQDYRYARSNRKLMHWAIGVLAAFLGLVVITGAGYFMINGQINTYQSRISDTKHILVVKDASNIEKQVSDISNNLKLMVQVLSKEILFDKLLERLGNLTPSNVILTNLSISQDQSAVDLTAQTSDYNAATQLQVNLTDPSNQVFQKADLVSIACATGNSVQNPQYPCTAEIRALFVNNNPYLFINSSGKKGGS